MLWSTYLKIEKLLFKLLSKIMYYYILLHLKTNNRACLPRWHTRGFLFVKIFLKHVSGNKLRRFMIAKTIFSKLFFPYLLLFFILHKKKKRKEKRNFANSSAINNAENNDFKIFQTFQQNSLWQSSKNLFDYVYKYIYI